MAFQVTVIKEIVKKSKTEGVWT